MGWYKNRLNGNNTSHVKRQELVQNQWLLWLFEQTILSHQIIKGCSQTDQQHRRIITLSLSPPPSHITGECTIWWVWGCPGNGWYSRAFRTVERLKELVSKCFSGVEPLVRTVYKELLHEIKESLVLWVLLEYVFLVRRKGRARGFNRQLLGNWVHSHN